MKTILSALVAAAITFLPLQLNAEEPIDSTSPLFAGLKANEGANFNQLSLRTNLIPWIAVIPNIGAALSFSKHWSAGLDVWYCPWVINAKHSLKCGLILPEVRWWPKTSVKGHYLNIHLSLGWYNLRYEDYRYQDSDRPLMGAGIGYGYLLEFNRHFGMEFSIGVGFINTRYNTYYNVPNGALMDTKISNYFGVDRLAVSLVYNLGDL